MKPYALDPNRILQQINCHDRKRQWFISISWGYSIQIYTYFLTAKELATPLLTFKTWRSSSDGPFMFKTRPLGPVPSLILWMVWRMLGIVGRKLGAEMTMLPGD
ncbi:hypothetical protein F2Q70_00043135 [Brassica cretica]|uniref:Uncharacterized protein n=1 Tax=Brassica cretica TaxID=69181 RepID=A0A8S9LTL5_BRACR|nr:hypothetical protein F2Q70_00043135 [Brassica cretica]KAF2609367.1 hypothetical protein F2Q68_00043936 [Brassica cretica]